MGYTTLLDKPKKLALFKQLAPTLRDSQLSRKFGITTSTAYHYRIRFNLPFHPSSKRKSATFSDMGAIAKMIRQGYSFSTISEVLDLFPPSLKRRIFKINLRPLGRLKNYLNPNFDHDSPIIEQLAPQGKCFKEQSRRLRKFFSTLDKNPLPKERAQRSPHSRGSPGPQSQGNPFLSSINSSQEHLSSNSLDKTELPSTDDKNP